MQIISASYHDDSLPDGSLFFQYTDQYVILSALKAEQVGEPFPLSEFGNISAQFQG